MKRLKADSGPLLVLAGVLLIAGCIVSATFVLDITLTDEDFAFGDNYYYTLVDWTEDEVWIDHSDKLDTIESIGLDMFITNTGEVTATFSAYVDDADNPVQTSVEDIEDNTTRVMNAVTIAAGTTRHITLGESYSMLAETDTLTAYGMEGRFHFYVTRTAAAGIFIDTVRVVAILGASES